MENHFIVCGLGNLGFHVVKLLRQFDEKVAVVTLEGRAEWLREAAEWGVQVFQGDARDPEYLEAVGIKKARAVLVLTGHDLVNTEIALDLKKMRSSLPVVVRIFDPVLARHLEGAFPLLRALAVSGLSAPTFAAAALGGKVVGTFKLDGSNYVVRQVTLTKSSPLVGLTRAQITEKYGLILLARDRRNAGDSANSGQFQANELAMFAATTSAWASLQSDPSVALTITTAPSQPGFFSPRFWWQLGLEIWRNAPAALRFALGMAVVLMVISTGVFHLAMNLSPLDAVYFLVSTVTTTGYGDITPKDSTAWIKLYVCLVMVLGSASFAVLYSVITDFLVTTRVKELLGRQRIVPTGQVIVVGLGHAGYRIIEELLALGVPAVAVDTNGDCPMASAARTKVPVIVGDARLPEVLEKAGVAHASAIIAATEDDAVNLGAALVARQQNSHIRTVVRCTDAAFGKKIQEAMKLDAGLSAAAIAAPSFVAAALDAGARTAFMPENSFMMIIVRPASNDWHGKTPAQLRADFDVALLLRQREMGTHWQSAGEAPLDKQENVLALVRRKTNLADKA